VQIVLLDALTFGETSLSAFESFGEVTVHQTTSPEQTEQRVIKADVIVTNKVVITEAIMQNAKNLKLICIAATGMNNVDLNAAKTLGIEVKNVAGYSTDSVIQHTFSMLFYLLGHSRYYDEVTKNAIYSKSGLFTDVSEPFFELKGKKWGIIGLGAIGRTSGVNRTEDFQRTTLDAMLQNCDIITVHAPLNDKTENLLDYEKLATCKEKAVVLNLGRGGIISENAVAQLVDEKEIYFGLDVFTKEPLDANSPLLAVKHTERLYLTPHIAWTSVEAREKLIASVVQNIQESL